MLLSGTRDQGATEHRACMLGLARLLCFTLSYSLAWVHSGTRQVPATQHSQTRLLMLVGARTRQAHAPLRDSRVAVCGVVLREEGEDDEAHL